MSELVHPVQDVRVVADREPVAVGVLVLQVGQRSRRALQGRGEQSAQRRQRQLRLGDAQVGPRAGPEAPPPRRTLTVTRAAMPLVYLCPTRTQPG